MTEYVVDFGDEKSSAFVRLAMAQAEANGARLCEEIVRCRDCKHANISSFGFCKYCEKFVLPDQDGYGPDPQVNLPLDFFCAYGERKEDA